MTEFPNTRYSDINVNRCPAGWHFENFDRMRETSPAHYGDGVLPGSRFWTFTTMGNMRAAYQDHTLFSSKAISVLSPEPTFSYIPEMLDPPLHTKWRRLLGPQFTPGAVDKMQPRIRARFQEILDDVAGRGECDYVQDVAVRFPNTIFMELMGLPVAEAVTFQQWETTLMHAESTPAQRAGAMAELTAYFTELIADRRARPRADLISTVLAGEIDGEPISDADMLSLCHLFFLAGLDTVASQLSYTMWHLATHDEDRRAIVADPPLIPTANEEFLRYYSFVTPSRKVMRDTDFQGCPVKAGEMVYLPLSAANRDSNEFEDAHKVIIDRPRNNHIAFGAGVHRCLGSNLARMELRIAVEEWHKHIPDYRLAPGATVTEHGGQIGLDAVPLVWEVSA